MLHLSTFNAAVKAMGTRNIWGYCTFEAEVENDFFVIRFSTAASSIKFRLSQDLISFLKLSPDEKTMREDSYDDSFHNHGVYQFNYETPKLSPLLGGSIVFPEDMAFPTPYIEYRGHARFTIPHTNYTIQQLAANFPALMKDRQYDLTCRWSFVYTETDEYYNWELKLEALLHIDIALHFSRGFRYYLGTSNFDAWEYLKTDGPAPPAVIKSGRVPKVKAVKKTYFHTTNIPHNYYPSADAFCEGLNKSIMDLADIYTGAGDWFKTPLFQMEKIGIVDALDRKKIQANVYFIHIHISTSLCIPLF